MGRKPYLTERTPGVLAMASGPQARRVAGIALAVAMSWTGSAFAALDQCAGGGIFEDGYVQAQTVTFGPPDPTDDIKGSSAQIIVRRGLVCESDNDTYTNLVHAYSGATGWNPSSGKYGWVEVGYRRYFNAPNIYHYTEDSETGNSFVRQTFGIASLGGEYTYKAETGNILCFCFRFFIAGTIVNNTTWDPEVSWESELINATWKGRTKYTQSDIPGLSTSQTRFRNLKIQDVDYDFVPATSAFFVLDNDNLARWALSGVSNNTFFEYCSVACT